MSTEIKNTLFRFVTMRAPELSNDTEQNLRFVLRPFDFESEFSSALGEAKKMEALKQAADGFEPKTMEHLKTILNQDIYNFSIWLAKNKMGYKKTELTTKIPIAISALGTIAPGILTDRKSILWDNIFYQVVTHKDFYTKEVAMQLLHAVHVIENYEAGNDAKNALLMKARVVLPKEYFVDEIADDADLAFSTLSTTPRVALLPNRIMRKQHIVAYTEHENEQLEKLKTDLNKVQKEYQKEYTAALKEAQDDHYATTKPILDAHKLAVKESLQSWCLVRDPQTEYNPKHPCSSPPVIPDPVLPAFNFEFAGEMDSEYINRLLPENLELFNTLTDQNTLQARGLRVAGLDFEKKSFLEDTDSISKTIASIDTNISNNTKLIVDNTVSSTRTLTSIGGILIPTSNHDSIVNPFDYELSTIALITGEQRASLSFEVPDSSWEMESFSYTFDKGSIVYFNLVSQSNRIGNHIILKSLPLGNLKINDRVTGPFNGEIVFTSGIKKNLVIGDYTPGSTFIGQLTGPVEAGIDGNDGFVPAGFGMKQLGIADYKRVEQTVHCYVEGEVAHIENIMAREYKEKSTRRLRKSENTTTSSSESEREQLTDTTSTERYDMQSEVARVIQQANDFSAGTQFSSKTANVEFGGFANFATHNSKEESTLQSVTQAKEITEKALDRIINKVKEERIEKIVEEYEENNKHGFDNTEGDKHVVGVYRWVDKLYKNKIVNYGKRLMFEFMIPQPAKLHGLGISEIADKTTDLTAPDDPRTFENNSTQLAGLLNLKDFSKVNATTLKYWASRYNVEIPTVLSEEIKIGDSFNILGDPNGARLRDTESNSGNAKIKIPEGYEAYAVEGFFNASSDYGYGGGNILSLTVGNKTVKNVDAFWQATLKLASDSGSPLTFSTPYQIEVPVSYTLGNHVSGDISISLNCKLTKNAEEKWKQETFKAIIDAYEDALAIFNEKKAQEQEKAGNIKDTNPGFYRQIENTILRKNCISYMIDRRVGAKKTYGLNMTSGNTFADYEVNLNQDLDNYASFVKFMEQAFEWDLMSYNLYPYYWGARADWSTLYQYDQSNDPLFRNFMQSGMARVVATVRPGFEEAVRYFLQTGKIWNGGEVPLIHDELFMSIVEELDEQEGKQEGKAWITRLPTSLTILQADSIGLTVEKALPCNCDDLINEETYENPEEALCSTNFDLLEGQNLSGGSSAQNNITRVLRVSYGMSGNGVQDKVLNALNTGLPYPVRFTILEGENYIITASPQGIPAVVGYVNPIFKYKVVNLGKNKTGEHYGFEGVALTSDNLELIFSNEAAVNDYLDNPSTQLIDLGWDITGTTLPDFLNVLETPLELQEQEDGYVIIKVIDNNEPRTYFFTGQGGTYGLSYIQAQSADFVLLNQTYRTTEETFVFTDNQKFGLSKPAKTVLLVTVNGQKLNKTNSDIQYFVNEINELEIVDILNTGDVVNIIYYYN